MLFKTLEMANIDCKRAIFSTFWYLGKEISVRYREADKTKSLMQGAINTIKL